ncbi:hypothetical protein JI752_009745 [Lysobacter sp. MMG2]|uniref:hypothetical protein n=1 Tax=Lysobacter sp. MMG2 TaxID=2801338 RepID=UPI001C213CD6|nr:hypothetical protein [Lysobacter sp. MMG2]MBU8976420.1 hypothetical protein [Lysobacter sp. MMG2]
MKRTYIAILAVACTAMMASAHASGGHITFVGSVMSPTCAPTAIEIPTHEVPKDIRTQCPKSPAPTHYTLHLQPAPSLKSALLAYYDGYVRASGNGQPAWIATQTYE